MTNRTGLLHAGLNLKYVHSSANREHFGDRLLMPAFGTIAIRDMLEEMRDISDQLLLKWERCVITIETLKVDRRV
jgi:hypothetical protein